MLRDRILNEQKVIYEIKKDPKIFIEHILESIREIERNTKNISEDEFLNLVTIQDAVARRLEIIGEAVKICRFLSETNTRRLPGRKLPVCAMCLFTNILEWILTLSGKSCIRIFRNSKSKLRK